MPLPLAAITGLAGSLLGGGSQTTQTTTVSSANSNTFNPNIVFGGDSSFNPATPTQNDFNAATISSQTQEQANPADVLSLLNPVGGIADSAAGQIASAAGSLISGNSAVPISTFTAATAAPAGGFDAPTFALIGAGVVGVGLFAFGSISKKKGR